MIRDADATRARLLEAATAEFARYGIAGARVDRIAAAARSNKAQIYHYFGSKDALFDAVYGAFASASLEEEHFDGALLPEVAGRIHDEFAAHPEIARLTNWYRLERADSGELIQEIVAANGVKLASIRAAQDAGAVTTRLPADVLLGLVLTLATAWTALPPEFAELETAYSPAERRRFVVEAVERLVTP